MSVPSLPKDGFGAPNGVLADKWRVYFETQANYLQSNLSQEGYVLPHQSTDNISALSTTDAQGGLLLDSDAEAAKVNTDGTYKNLTTLEQLTTTEIDAIPSGKRNGRFFHDTTTGDLKIGFNDQIKTVTVT